MGAYAVRPGTQYRQDPHIWGDPLTPGGAKYSQNYIRHEKRVSSPGVGQGKLSAKMVFRQSR
jgi:hypothetical protein